MIQDIYALIHSLGQTATLRRVSGGVYSPATGTISSTTNEDEEIQTALVSYRERETDGTLIKSGDRKALVAARDLEKVPQVGDFLIVGGVTLSVVDVHNLSPSGTAVGYALQVRE